MGDLYLSSNESIILSTNNVVVNSVQAEAILTNERLMLIDARHAELRPQDIPFHAIATVMIGEDANLDPMLSLALLTAPGVTQTIDMVFPQMPRTKRVSERNEWANRLRELSTVSAREDGASPAQILPPWVPGEVPAGEETKAPPAAEAGAASPFRNPPLAPRKPRAPAPKDRTVMAVAAVVVVVVIVAVMAYLVAPSLFGKGAPLPPAATTVPATVPATAPVTTATTVVTTVATTQTPQVPATTAALAIPQTGVWVRVIYAGSYTGTAGLPGRFRDIADKGEHLYQIPAKDEIISATITKQDNTGNRLTVEIYNNGALIQSGAVSAPKGTVDIDADLRSP